MGLKGVIDKVLEDQKRSFSWLAEEMGMSNEGLKLALVRETVKFSDLKKLLGVLNIPITLLIEGDDNNINVGAGNRIAITKGGELEAYKELVKALQDQLKDKEKIIELLSKK